MTVLNCNMMQHACVNMMQPCIRRGVPSGYNSLAKKVERSHRSLRAAFQFSAPAIIDRIDRKTEGPRYIMREVVLRKDATYHCLRMIFPRHAFT